MISQTRFNDYPKLGVWPDGYYITFNDFDHGGPFVGATVVALDRAAMIAGNAATTVKFVLGSAFGGLLPSDLDGSAVPPAGSPNYVVQFDDDGAGYPQDQLEINKFHVDFGTPGNSTFTAQPVVARRPSTRTSRTSRRRAGPALESLTDRLMYRLAYRNFGDHEAMVVNHTVDSNGANLAGFRWYELRRTGGNWGIFQQSTYAPDSPEPLDGQRRDGQEGRHRGRLLVRELVELRVDRVRGPARDRPGEHVHDGVDDARTGTRRPAGSAVRWGDYSSIQVDPTDDCTFWYTTEYIQTTGNVPWQTRVGSFTYPGCATAQQPPSITNFTPASGPPLTSVTINGSGFTGTSAVKFNGTTASYTVNSNTKITATVPSNATTGKIAVTNSLGTATSTQTFTVTKAPGGRRSRRSRRPGPQGDERRHHGHELRRGDSVKLGSAAATFTVVSPTRINAVVPNVRNGYYHWSVTRPGWNRDQPSSSSASSRSRSGSGTGSRLSPMRPQHLGVTRTAAGPSGTPYCFARRASFAR